jgi:sn-glycerol 3-phosphate transport system permease protein
MGAEQMQAPWKRALWYLVLTALTLVVLFPIYMAVVRAISTPIDYLNAGQPPWPVAIQVNPWTTAITEGNLGPKFGISLVVTLIIVVAQMITSILAAYAFAFLRFPLKRTIFILFIATMMLPIEVTLIPNLQTIRSLGWLNSFPGLTAPFLANAVGIFLLRQGFLGIPRDLRDAAQLDGFGHLAFIRRVAIPVTRPVIAAYAVLAFITAWNQYTWPRAAVTEERFQTLQVGLKTLTNATLDRANIGVAGALIAAVPLLLILLIFQRHVVRGLTAGAVKG